MTSTFWGRYGLAAAAASVAGVFLLRNRHRGNKDAAPARTARHVDRFGDYRVAGAMVTIRATPEQIMLCWNTLPAVWSAMEFIPFPEGNQPGLLLPPPGLREMAALPVLIKTVASREDELLAWQSEGPDHADMHGRMRLTENGTKGIAVEVIMAVRPRDFRSVMQTEAAMADSLDKGILRDLRRIKMLIEAGEIATTGGEPALGQESVLTM